MDDLFRSYIVLGVRPGASAADVKRAYRKLARECHPDRIADEPRKAEAEARLREINEAYATLQARPDVFANRHAPAAESESQLPAYDAYTWRRRMAEQTQVDDRQADEEFYHRALMLYFDGMDHARMGRWRDAVSCLSQTVFMVRNNPDAWIALARCYRRLNQPQKAESAYKEALRIDPRCAEARTELAETYDALMNSRL